MQESLRDFHRYRLLNYALSDGLNTFLVFRSDGSMCSVLLNYVSVKHLA